MREKSAKARFNERPRGEETGNWSSVRGGRKAESKELDLNCSSMTSRERLLDLSFPARAGAARLPSQRERASEQRAAYRVETEEERADCMAGVAGNGGRKEEERVGAGL